jgi:predicted outer membrane repeat protein
VLLLLTLPAVTPAATIHVSGSGGGDYATIQEGINAASTGDTVIVGPGTYTGPQNRELDTGGVDMVVMSQTGPENTIIDCGRLGRAFHIHLEESGETAVSGFTITRGLASSGGGILVYNAGPVIENCVFRDNTATEGGAIHARVDASPQIDGCTFEGNAADDYGGAVYSYLATPYVSRCEFTANSAGISGGGVSLQTGTVARLYDCSFVGNWAGDGGGVYIGVLDVPTPERDIPEASIVNYCRFLGNTATRGAGLFVNAYSWSLCTYSTFAHNTATDGGGIFVLSDLGPSLSVQYCTIVLNEALYGGGIFAVGGDDQYQPSVSTSIIAFNSEGEAVYRQWGAPVAVDKVCVYANENGDDELIGTRILRQDPLFCDIYGDDFRLCENSECRQVNNQWHFLFGATSLYCAWCMSPVEVQSWGAIKAMFR